MCSLAARHGAATGHIATSLLREHSLYGNVNYSMMHGSANPPPDPELSPFKTRKSRVCEQEQHRCCKVTGKNGKFCLCVRLGFDPACLFSSIGTGTCCIARCRQRYMMRPAPGSSPRSLYLQCAGKIVIVQSFSLQIERIFGGILLFRNASGAVKTGLMCHINNEATVAIFTAFLACRHEKAPFHLMVNIYIYTLAHTLSRHRQKNNNSVRR